MVIGIISEGHSDRAVIENILVGITGISYSDIIALRPQDNFDATDMANINPDSFGGWNSVKTECENRVKIDEFLSIEGNLVAIHLDGAECELYPAARPPKDESYCLNLRYAIEMLIDGWLGGRDIDRVLHAIAIEEIESWLLPIYTPGNETIQYPNPKRKLNQILSRKEIDSTINHRNYRILSIDFKNKNRVIKNKYLDYNCSLKLFCQEVENKCI